MFLRGEGAKEEEGYTGDINNEAAVSVPEVVCCFSGIKYLYF
jgi:hypothetical protein